MKAFLKSAFFGALLVLSACAKDNGGGNSGPAVVPGPSCGGVAGQVQTQYGCAPTAGCPANQGMYNGVCYPAYTNNAGYGSCTSGQIYTTYGCMPTAGCPANQGMYNGACIQGYQNGGYYGNGGGYYGGGGGYYGGGGGYYYNNSGSYGSPYYYGNPYYGGYGGGAGFYIGGRAGFGY